MKTLAFVTLVLASGCSQKNANYCPGNPDNNCLEDAATDGSGSNNNCPAVACATGVCDTATHTCVQCTSSQPAACMDTTPVCGANDTCRPCGAHAECPISNVCLPSGACGDETQIAYVDATLGTANTTCSQAMPCTTIAAALNTGHPYIKVTGIISEPVSINTSSPVTFLGAPGAELTESSSGPILTVSGTASVSVYDLEIYGALGPTVGDAIYMPTGTPTVSLHRVKIDHSGRYGVYANVGTLSIDRSTISQNTGGGLNLSNVSFDIKNSFITQNPGSLGFGGILINQPGAVHAIEFTTIANNNGDVTNDSNGVTCGTLTSVITFSNNIVYGNTGTAQIFGSKCAYAYSDIGPTAASGATNVNMDPMFKDPANGDFHLMSGSMLKDMADPAASVLFDFDGNPRPQGLHSDMGADEVMP